MTNSLRYVFQRSVAGGTLLAFLLVQLRWSPTASAGDALRPTTEGKVAAGLEEALHRSQPAAEPGEPPRGGRTVWTQRALAPFCYRGPGDWGLAQ